MSRVLGICTKIKGKRATSAAVVLEGTRSAPVVCETFELTSSEDDASDRIFDIASHLRSRLAGLGVDTVVVRRADHKRKASNQEGPHVRLMIEGALTASAHEVVSDVRLAPGRDLAQAVGTTKDDLVSEAAALGVAEAFTDAAAAGLAGLPA